MILGVLNCISYLSLHKYHTNILRRKTGKRQVGMHCIYHFHRVRINFPQNMTFPFPLYTIESFSAMANPTTRKTEKISFCNLEHSKGSS